MPIFYSLIVFINFKNFLYMQQQQSLNLYNLKQRIRMSSKFQHKLATLKQTIIEQTTKNNQNAEHSKLAHNCSNLQIKVNENTSKASRNDLIIQQPIIIQRKIAVQSKPSSARKQTPRQNQKLAINNTINTIKNKSTSQIRRQIQPFKPIQVPQYDKKIDLKAINIPTTTDTPCTNKEIQIKIEKDDKECLKKLFKKVHKLTEQLAVAQKQNMKLKTELQNYQNVSKVCNNHEKIINRLQGDKYKLQVDLSFTKKLLQQNQEQLKRLKAFVPKQIIKQVVIEKPVEVQIEVPKIVPGPQRVVQRIVEIPKYIQIQKKVPIQQSYQPPRQVIRTIQVPTIVQKPVYIDKPIYIDRPVQIQKRVQVPIEMPPIEVPIYIDRPIVPQQYQIKIRSLQEQVQQLIKVNDMMAHQNRELKFSLQKLTANLQILSRHNHEKNRQTQLLMQNSFDYYPISPGVDLSGGSIRYSVSSHPHTRVI